MTETVGKTVGETVRKFKPDDDKGALSFIMDEISKSNLDKTAQVLVILWLAKAYHVLFETRGYVNWVEANKEWNKDCIL